MQHVMCLSTNNATAQYQHMGKVQQVEMDGMYHFEIPKLLYKIKKLVLKNINKLSEKNHWS